MRGGYRGVPEGANCFIRHGVGTGIANPVHLRDSLIRISVQAHPQVCHSENRRAAMARKNPTLPAKPSSRSASEARSDLVARAGRNADGARLCRSDPLADAQAAVAVVRAVEEHAAELARRGLNGAYCAAALQLARDIGLGDPFSARQPAHIARALTRILAALETHREVRADIGLLPEDVQTMQDLARDLGAIAGAPATVSDEQAQLLEAQGALRAFFDLFAAKASLALAGDPDERARLLSLLPRAEERRHLRREPTRASG